MVKEINFKQIGSKTCRICRKDIGKISDNSYSSTNSINSTNSDQSDDLVLTISNLKYDRDKKNKPLTSDECMGGRFHLVGDLRAILEGRKAENKVLIRPEQNHEVEMEEMERWKHTIKNDTRRCERVRSAFNNRSNVKMISDRIFPVVRSNQVIKVDSGAQKDFPQEQDDVVTIHLENKRVQTNKSSEQTPSSTTNTANTTNNSIINGQTRKLKYVLSTKPSQESNEEPRPNEEPAGKALSKTIKKEIVTPPHPLRESIFVPSEKRPQSPQTIERASRSMTLTPRSPARTPRSPPRSQRNTRDREILNTAKVEVEAKHSNKDNTMSHDQKINGRTVIPSPRSVGSKDSLFYYGPWSHYSDRDRSRRLSRIIERSYDVDPYDVRVLVQILHPHPGLIHPPPLEIIQLVQCCENHCRPDNLCWDCPQRSILTRTVPPSLGCSDGRCHCQSCHGSEVYRIIKCNGY